MDSRNVDRYFRFISSLTQQQEKPLFETDTALIFRPFDEPEDNPIISVFINNNYLLNAIKIS